MFFRQMLTHPGHLTHVDIEPGLLEGLPCHGDPQWLPDMHLSTGDCPQTSCRLVSTSHQENRALLHDHGTDAHHGEVTSGHRRGA